MSGITPTITWNAAASVADKVVNSLGNRLPITHLDLMADGAHRLVAFSVEKNGVAAVHYAAGCPGGQSRKNALARGGVCVLIHHVNTN